jgi:hypothetical protein
MGSLKVLQGKNFWGEKAKMEKGEKGKAFKIIVHPKWCPAEILPRNAGLQTAKWSRRL